MIIISNNNTYNNNINEWITIMHLRKENSRFCRDSKPGPSRERRKCLSFDNGHLFDLAMVSKNNNRLVKLVHVHRNRTLSNEHFYSFFFND